MSEGIRSSGLNKPTIEAVSGLSAGFITTLVTHPLDLLKLRMQLDTSSSPWRHIRIQARELYADSLDPASGRLSYSRLVREVYRGITPNLVGSTTAWGLYFMFYSEYKTLAEQLTGELGSGAYLASGFAAGVSTSVLTNPIWVLKTRIISTSSRVPGAYRSTMDGVRRILREEGILGFWKGLPPALISVSQGALQFSLYDSMKKRIVDTQDTALSTSQYIYASAVSKMASTVALYPFQVMRSRLQGYSAAGSMSQVALQLVQKEGVAGFYKGVIPNLVRVVPATCITFVVYENSRKLLS